MRARSKTIWICSVFLVAAGAFLFWFYGRTHDGGIRESCMNNLRQIDGAKHSWSLESRKATNDVTHWEDIRPYLGRGTVGEILVCPNGGIYILGRVGESPRCSIGGLEHTLP